VPLDLLAGLGANPHPLKAHPLKRGCDEELRLGSDTVLDHVTESWTHDNSWLLQHFIAKG